MGAKRKAGVGKNSQKKTQKVDVGESLLLVEAPGRLLVSSLSAGFIKGLHQVLQQRQKPGAISTIWLALKRQLKPFF